MAKQIKNLTTSFPVLMRLAAAVGRAKKSGDPEAIAKAEKEHDDYLKLCREANSMTLEVRYGDL